MPKIIDGHKVCPQCNKNVPVEGYGFNRCNPNGIQSWCLECCRVIDRQRTKDGRATKRRDKTRAYNLEKKYGITQDQYEEIFKKQNYKCAICKTDKPGGTGHWCVDHDHALFHFVRGILCHHCNSLLGYAKDSQEILSNANKYLDIQYVAY